jgi:hypothetical protein
MRLRLVQLSAIAPLDCHAITESCQNPDRKLPSPYGSLCMGKSCFSPALCVRHKASPRI